MNVPFQKSFPRKGVGKTLPKIFAAISILGVQCFQNLTSISDNKSTKTHFQLQYYEQNLYQHNHINTEILPDLNSSTSASIPKQSIQWNPGDNL